MPSLYFLSCLVIRFVQPTYGIISTNETSNNGTMGDVQKETFPSFTLSDLAVSSNESIGRASEGK